MTETKRAHYREIGVSLTAVIRGDYRPDIAESITLLRCEICGALVEGNWENENYQHTDWHERLGQ